MARPLGTTLSLCCLAMLLPWGASRAETAAATPAAEAPATEAAIEHAPVTERSADEAQALERQLPVGEQQQLHAGTDDFLALWKPANSADPSGIVILLPGDGESADWPQAVGPLRNKLPDAGWHTLSLTLPDPHDPAPEATALAAPPAVEPPPSTEPASPAASAAESPAAPTEPAAVANAEAAATDSAVATPAESTPVISRAPPEQHAERVLARIQAALEFAQQKQAKSIVLIGHGSGGYWASRYLSERQPAQVQNLLLVAVSLPDGFSPPLDELLPNLRLAVGDFYYKDQPADRTAAVKRQQASKRQQNPAYIQVAMKALPGNPGTEQEQLYRRIRGWLSLHLQARPSAPGA